MTITDTSQVAAAFALAIAVTSFSASSSFAFSSEAQQMCTGDAMRLCGAESPNISRIAVCMHKQRAKLSVGCRAVMDRDDAAARKATKETAAN
jgi:hypothetical protein